MSLMISKYFSLSELLKSDTALRKGYKNQWSPSTEVIKRLTDLAVNVLDPIREEFGPFSPQSAYRCPELNADRSINGGKYSYHLFGMAADISLGSRNAELFEFIKNNLKFCELIWEYGTDGNPDWVHVAYDRFGGRAPVKRATKGLFGNTKYTILGYKG